MRPTSYKFQWFEQEDGRRKLRASLSLEGKLRLGRTLRSKLPPFIRVGFDAEAMVLAIADGHGAGIGCPACGVVNARALSAQVTATGLRLPVSFDLKRDELTGYFLGQIILHSKLDGTGRRRFDMEQVVILFRPLVDKIVYQMGKSTPLAERRSIATEAMCAAMQEYQTGYGDLGAYLEDRIRRTLCTENRQYFEEFRRRSLDQGLSGDEEDGFCLYDAIPEGQSTWTDSVDSQIDQERFCASLSPEQQELVGMLREGFRISEIMDLLDISEREVRKLSAEIARRRRKFDGEA